MNKLVTFLNGKKTYVGLILGTIYSLLIALGVVESNEFVWTLIVTWTGVSFRLALNKQ